MKSDFKIIMKSSQTFGMHKNPIYPISTHTKNTIKLREGTFTFQKKAQHQRIYAFVFAKGIFHYITKLWQSRCGFFFFLLKKLLFSGMQYSRVVFKHKICKIDILTKAIWNETNLILQ